MNCDIDINRLVDRCINGDICWCEDYFGLLGNNRLLADTDVNKGTPFERVVFSLYVENGKEFWLSYYFSLDEDTNILQVFLYEDFLSLSEDTRYTVYDREELLSMNDVMRMGASNLSWSAKVRTYDAYLQFHRNFMLTYYSNRNDEDVWGLLNKIHEMRGIDDIGVEQYLKNHSCQVCGCYFLSTDVMCADCGFTGINNVFLNRTDYQRWLEECLQPYRTAWLARKKD